MSRTLFRLAAVSAVFVAVSSCNDSTLAPTSGSPQPVFGVSSAPAPDQPIKDLILQLFPQGLEEAATSHWTNVTRKLGQGDITDARSKLTEAVSFIREKTPDLIAPAGETQAHAAARLIQLMSEYVYGGSSGGVTALIEPATEATVVTPNKFAGIKLPAGAVSVPTVLVIYEDARQGWLPCKGPLPTSLCQYPRFYHFDIIPHVRLNTPAKVGVCHVLEGANAPTRAVDGRLRVAHDAPTDPAGYTPGGSHVDGVEILPLTHIDFLDCGHETVSLLNSHRSNSLADRGWRALDKLASAASWLVVPKTAYAIDQGGGGETMDFSTFEIVDPGPPPAPTDATAPEVTPVVTGTSHNGWYTSNVDVSWAVVDNQSAITTQPCASSSVTADTNGETFTCTATSAGGTTTQSVTIKRDATPPVITSNVPGPNGANGWYTGDVTVTWSATDDISGSTTCADGLVNFDTRGETINCSATNGAGLSSSGVPVTIKRDASPPVITSNVPAPNGANGWYTGDVTVTWSATDDVSGSTTCADGLVNFDTRGETLNCSATNGAGLTSDPKTITIKRDATPPTIAYSGNAGTYTVDQTVAITCSASDATSGLASDNCQDISRDAYTFELGAHSVSATATDSAGKSNSASASFSVEVTSASLCALTRKFSSNADIASALCAKLTAYQASIARGSSTSAAGQVGAYINQVQAQTGKAIPSAKASILISLAKALHG